jgi:hypothetical protein
MSSSFQFRDQWYSLAPPWLTTGNAERYMYTLQLCSDLLMEKCNQAVQIRFPGQGDPSQLPYLSFDRQLQQATNESNRAFVARLSNAFNQWGIAGSTEAVLTAVQIHLQGYVTGVPANYPWLTVVGGSFLTVATYQQLYQGSALGSPPTLTTVETSNFDWDGKANSWRSWFVMFMALVSTGLSGSSAQTSTATAGSFTSPGQLGSAVAQSGITYPGTWIPATSGTPVNHPWLTITGLSGLTTSNVGEWLVLSGSSHATNNGTFPIVSVLSATSCVIANPSGVTSDSGPLTWAVKYYPFIGPGPVWGDPGYVFGQGELQTPAIDYGSVIGGVWQPSNLGSLAQTANGSYQPTISWGLNINAETISAVRSLIQTWKSAATYFESIVIAFDGGDGSAGSAYSPNSEPGSGNPDGTFGGRGKLVSGVWVPNRLVSSPFDAYCQGTGSWSGCSVPNVT